MSALLIVHGVNPAIIQQNVQGVPLASNVAASFSEAMAGALWLPAGVAIAGAVLTIFLSGRAGRPAEPDAHDANNAHAAHDGRL